MPAAVAMRDLIARGLLGEVYQVSFLNNVRTPWDLWPWVVAGERVEVLYHSIHYLDTVRALLRREPRLVFADGATLPGFQTGGETRTVIHLIFDGDLRAHRAQIVRDGRNAIRFFDAQFLCMPDGRFAARQNGCYG